MKPIFLNWKGPQGRETVEEIRAEDLAEYWAGDQNAARKEARRLVSEYAMCGMNVYTSSRPCANWKE
jgi:hypothetical protein